MMICQERRQRQRLAGIFLKRGDPQTQAGTVFIGRPDVVQNVLRGLLFQLNKASLRNGDKAVPDLPGNPARRIGKQRGKLFLEAVFFVRLPDKIQHREALFPLAKAQASSQLLQKNRQRLGRTQKQHGIDFRDIDAFVIKIDHEDQAHLAGHQLRLRVPSLLVRRLSRQIHGRDPFVVKIVAHERRVLDADAEAETLYLVDIRYILED